MGTCCLYNLTEPIRQKILLILLGLEGVLTLAGFIMMCVAVHIKVTLKKYIEAVRLANEEAHTTGRGQLSTFTYILSVGVISILLHAVAIKLWFDSRNWKKREKMNYIIPAYLWVRVIYIILFLSAIIANKVQENAIRVAFELASEEIQLSTREIVHVFVRTFTKFLGGVSVVEVCIDICFRGVVKGNLNSESYFFSSYNGTITQWTHHLKSTSAAQPKHEQT